MTNAEIQKCLPARVTVQGTSDSQLQEALFNEPNVLEAEVLAVVWALSPTPAGERMHPLELLAAREALGLTREVLADALDVSVSLVRTWERGQSTIPDDVRRRLEHLEAYTDALAAALAARLTRRNASAAPTIGAYTRDDELPAIPLPGAPLTPTARWWRVVAYRTARAVRGARITSGAIITDATLETADMVVDGTPVQVKQYTGPAGKPR
ncbi:helix-turn-helix domain-containing protein [Kocuria flava]|nr:helix-turn-helix domain-containing protein [Kocuria flava]